MPAMQRLHHRKSLAALSYFLRKNGQHNGWQVQVYLRACSLKAGFRQVQRSVGKTNLHGTAPQLFQHSGHARLQKQSGHQRVFVDLRPHEQSFDPLRRGVFLLVSSKACQRLRPEISCRHARAPACPLEPAAPPLQSRKALPRNGPTIAVQH